LKRNPCYARTPQSTSLEVALEAKLGVEILEKHPLVDAVGLHHGVFLLLLELDLSTDKTNGENAFKISCSKTDKMDIILSTSSIFCFSVPEEIK
jgi:hypothetical protein